ncbi:MAG: dihydropteroate synthase [Opitutaceae bacterium]|nr:dihydropteroate synthase [Opitutaceae bacterium]
MNPPELHVIGELMNNSYGRARKAWQARHVAGYQELAKIQTDLGVSFLTLNVDGTQRLSVTLQEMLDFLPHVIPAIQEVTDVPLSFDNPNVAFHRECLRHYNPAKSKGRAILNSISISRNNIAEMIQLVREYNLNVIVMASECLLPDGSHGSARTVGDILNATKHFVSMLREQAGIANERIIIDPGLAPVASDTSGLINLCLDSIRAIRSEKNLAGIHISVGLSNFAIGAPKPMQVPLERAFLALAMEAGLDFALSNPEKNTVPMSQDEKLVQDLIRILEAGRVRLGETQEDAGYRQLDALMELWGDRN